MSTVETLAGVDKLAALIRRLDGNHDLGTGALAELLVEHGVVLYCLHPNLTRQLGPHNGAFGHSAECEDCGSSWWSAGQPPEVTPQRLAGIDPTQTV